MAELKQRLDSLLPIWEIKVKKLRIGVVGLGGMRKKRGYRCWRQRLTGRYKVVVAYARESPANL